MVKWVPPQQGWIKCNTNGASKENPGPSSYGFCLRDTRGDLIYAEAVECGVMSNMEAEVIAI